MDDHQPAGPPGTPLHVIFGGGKVADILLWRNKQKSAAFLVGVTVIWFLVEVMNYNLFTVACNILIWVMVILFLWPAGLLGWTPPDIQAITIPESTFNWLSQDLNSILQKFYAISSRKDWKTLFLAISLVWMLSIIGRLFSSLNRLYIGFLCLMTLPTLFERHQNDLQCLAQKTISDLINRGRDLIRRQ